jgi:phosphoribosyl 1,2-cyclic phosphodiesterase
MNFPRLRENRERLRARRIMLTHMNPSMLAHVEEARAEGLLVAEDGFVLEF